MTTALLPFTPLRAKQSTMMRRWLLGGRGGAWFYLQKRDLRDVWAEHAEAVVQHHAGHASAAVVGIRQPGAAAAIGWDRNAPA
jgi:hypothetical protein